MDRDRFTALVRHIDPRFELLRTWPLAGGVSAQMTAFEVQQADGQSKKLVLRRHGEIDRCQNPRIAADEFRLLQLVNAAGIAAPTPTCFDLSCEIVPTPYIVLGYVEGATDLAPVDINAYIRQLASQLGAIHALKPVNMDLSFLPRQQQGNSARSAALGDSLSEGRIRDALEAFDPVPRNNEAVLLHGDYWPGNLLWRDGRLVAVIDWEDAAVGDPLADVANARLEILWAFGADVMRAFTADYRRANAIDASNLPYWDLCAALRPAGKLDSWGLDAHRLATMRTRHSWFVEQALTMLTNDHERPIGNQTR